jgi:hypothetical protein
MTYVHDDGGRKAAGYTGDTRDCVTRAIAIATGLPYQEVYDDLHQAALSDRAYMAKLELHYGARARSHASPRTGASKRHYGRWLEEHGWEWTPTMGIGTGCTVHLRADELPAGRIIARLSRHTVAVIDGVVHDTFDPRRLDEDGNATRCVYGVWREPGAEPWLP